MNFKNLMNDPPVDESPRLDYQLNRQSSIYSLTFDEFQSSVGGIGKDFGSMNMDELLKNIWSAEETHIMVSSSVANSVKEVSGWADGSGHLQRQGSLTLPRTISQKTVDEVWKDLVSEYSVDKDGTGGLASTNLHRQQTLGEMTLEDFLFRAGVVRENEQISEKPKSEGIFGNATGSEVNCQPHTGLDSIFLNNRISGSNNQFSNRPSNFPLNTNAVQTDPKQQQIIAKKPPVKYGSQLSSPGIISGVLGVSDQGLNNGLHQGSGLQSNGFGVVNVAPMPVTVAKESPVNQLSSKSNDDTSSVSPVPYMFNGGVRGRKNTGPLEKVIDRRQKRMIKNRESAARSRARKQAYTMELEAEVAKLKEENQELRRKQAEILERQKNLALQMMDLQQQGAKKQCLRRTQTGPW